MKKSTAKRPARRVKTKVKRVAQRAVRLTESSAAKALADLKSAITAQQRPAAGPGSAQRVKRVFALATKLNQLVKRMKSAHLI